MNALLNAYINTQHSYFTNSFMGYGIEKTMNGFFHFLEINAPVEDYKLIVRNLAKNCNVQFKLENDHVVSDITYLAIMETMRTRMREILTNYWREQISEIEKDKKIWPPGFIDEETLKRYKILLETYDGKFQPAPHRSAI